MPSSSHVLCVNFRAQNQTHYQIIERWLMDDTSILDFRSFIPLVYFIKTNFSATQIAQRMRFMFPDGGLIISRIDPSDLDGMLGQHEWTWFYQDTSKFGNIAAALGYLGTRKT